MKVTRERGEFKTKKEGRRTIEYFVVKERWEEEIPCGAEAYEVLERGIFTSASGYDPLGLKVKCKNCENEYYLFPRKDIEANK